MKSDIDQLQDLRKLARCVNSMVSSIYAILFDTADYRKNKVNIEKLNVIFHDDNDNDNNNSNTNDNHYYYWPYYYYCY